METLNRTWHECAAKKAVEADRQNTLDVILYQGIWGLEDGEVPPYRIRFCPYCGERLTPPANSVEDPICENCDHPKSRHGGPLGCDATWVGGDQDDVYCRCDDFVASLGEQEG